jgi:FAD/FMN-containing dehydrogenase
LFDSRDPDQLKRVHEAGWEIMQACVALGGTISGEHGIGLEKMDAMRMVFSDADIETQRSLQGAFDPFRVLNPGKMFPDTTQPFEAAWAAADDALTGAEKGMAEIVKQAVAAGGALTPIGSGSLAGLGNAATHPLTPLPSHALGELIDLDPSNQYITAGAGMTLAGIQAKLAAHNQWLPLRPAFSLLRRTIGGVTATGACGPERSAYGAPRRLLLGLRFIDGRGRLINAGGKVVKNVAGYDLTRLVAGSFGTLGIITRVTMKTATRPERCATISACGVLEACGSLAAQVLGSSLGAVFATAAPEDGGESWRLQIGFEGFGETVGSQLARAEALLAEAGFRSIRSEDYDVLSGPFGGLYDRISACPFVLRAGAPPDLAGRGAAVLRQQTRVEAVLVDFGCGRIRAGSSDVSDESWLEIGQRLHALTGHVVLEKAPDEFKQRNDVFGPPRPEWKLMHRVKDILDPHHIFAPGRMPRRV